MKDWYWASMYVSIYSSLLIVVVFMIAWLYWKINIKDQVLQIIIGKRKDVKKDICCFLILILAVIQFLLEEANLIYISSGHQGSVINNIYNLVQFIMLSTFYHYLHEEGALFRKRNIVWIGVIIVIAIFITYTIATGSFQLYQTSTWAVQSSILISYSLYTFIRLRGGPLVDDRELGAVGNDMYSTILKIVSAPVWLNIGVLLYFSGSLIIACIETYILPHLFVDNAYLEEAYLFWMVHNVLNIAKNLFFALFLYYGAKYGLARRKVIQSASYNRRELYN